MPMNMPICIEISSDLFKTFQDKQTIFHLFQCQEVQWDPLKIEINLKANDPYQFVCKYLRALQQNQLSTLEINENDPSIISKNECLQILQRQFPQLFNGSMKNPNFNFLKLIIYSLYDQFLYFSRSVYFWIEILKEQQVNPNERQIIIEITVKQFTELCLQNDGLEIKANYNNSEQKSVDAISKMLKWQDNKPLIFTFTEQGSLILLFKNPSQISQEIQQLYERYSAGKEKLKSYDDMNQDEIIMKIINLCITAKQEQNFKTGEKSIKKESLVQTKDTFLKLALIFLRYRANLPTFLMGETGIGKTAILEYLQFILDVPISKLNVHAGISEEEIITFTKKCNNIANTIQTKMIVFFDEINTNIHVTSLFKEIVIDRYLLGKKLSDNIVFVSALNPYKTKNGRSTLSAGIQRQQQQNQESLLVYSVNPLPQSIMSFLFDFGQILPQDENKYIDKMISKENNLYNNPLTCQESQIISQVVFSSQKFLKTYEAEWSVSLRDVSRFSKLLFYFYEKNTQNDVQYSYQSYYNYWTDKQQKNVAIILALSFIYLFRISRKELRQKYIKEVYGKYYKNGNYYFKEVLEKEQTNYLNHIELPPCIGKNTPLKENVFAIITCASNNIPLFITGKPGSSKTLAINLVTKSMKGRSSHNQFFQQRPSLLPFTYQGSEQSKSSGIEKIFERAITCQNEFKENENTRVIVIIDEIGLAEISPHNPLKVLHSLLEPPKVATIGISNWPLDASKMNRGITLSRPDPDIEDLEESAQQIAIEIIKDKSNYKNFNYYYLKNIVKGYQQIQLHQESPNFHGLRDFYSLITYVCRNISNNYQDIEKSIIQGFQRNFGGIQNFDHQLGKFLSEFPQIENYKRFLLHSKELIVSNLNDSLSRHLMVIIQSQENAIQFIENECIIMDKEYQIIYGSDFAEDLNEESAYRLINQIILSMEKGSIVVLMNLQSIYQSFYDMLNQNYQYSGSQKFCKVAIGPESSRCIVHDDFKCIIIAENEQVKSMDAPLLNRFDKQFYYEEDDIDADEKQLVKIIYNQIEKGCQSSFSITDTFPLLNNQKLVASVVSSNKDIQDYQQKQRVSFNEIIQGATYAGILRMANNQQFFIEFMNQQHQNLFKYLIELKGEWENQIYQKPKIGRFTKSGFNVLIYTYSPTLENIKKRIQDLFKMFEPFIYLNEIYSERKFKTQVSEYFNSQQNLLVIFADLRVDSKFRISLCKSIINIEREYYQKQNGRFSDKYIVFIIKINEQGFEGFSYNSQWKQVTIDVLNGQDNTNIQIKELLQPAEQILQNEDICFKFINICLVGAISQVSYGQNDVYLKQRIELIYDSINKQDRLKDVFFKLVQEQIQLKDIEVYNSGNQWQQTVAQDKSLMKNNLYFHSAAIDFFSKIFKKHCSYLIYYLEKCQIFDIFDGISRINKNSDIIMNIFLTRFQQKYSNQENKIKYTIKHCPLKFPFSSQIHKSIVQLKDNFIKDITADKHNPQLITLQQQQIKYEERVRILDRQFEQILTNEFQELISQNVNGYLSDTLQISFQNIENNMKLFLEQSINMFLDPVLRQRDFQIYEIYGILWKEQDMLAKVYNLFQILLSIYSFKDIWSELLNKQKIITPNFYENQFLTRDLYLKIYLDTIYNLILPSQELFKKIQMMKLNWINIVDQVQDKMLIINCLYQNKEESNILNILQFLKEIYNDLIIPLNLPIEILIKFSNNLNQSQISFKKEFAQGRILKELINLKEKHKIQSLTFDKFKYKLIYQSLMTERQKMNEDLIKQTLNQIFQDTNNQLYQSQLQFHIIRCLKCIITQVTRKDFIDFALKKLVIDNYILDAFNSNIKKQLRLGEDEEETKTTDLIQQQKVNFNHNALILIFDSIDEHFSQDNSIYYIQPKDLDLLIMKALDKNKVSFKRIVALAYVKQILNSLNNEIIQAKKENSSQIQNYLEIRDVFNYVFNQKNIQSQSLQYYLLKLLKQNYSLSKIQNEINGKYVQFDSQIFEEIVIKNIRYITLNDPKEKELVNLFIESNFKQLDKELKSNKSLFVFIRYLFGINFLQQEQSDQHINQETIKKISLSRMCKSIMSKYCFKAQSLPEQLYQRDLTSEQIFQSYLSVLMLSQSDSFFGFESMNLQSFNSIFFPFQFLHHFYYVLHTTDTVFGTVALYECINCKEPFIIGDCGGINNHRSKDPLKINVGGMNCNKCQKQVGYKGESNSKLKYARQDPKKMVLDHQKGYIQTEIIPQDMTVRQLTQIQFRIGHLISHYMILLQIIVGDNNKFSQEILKQDQQRAAQYLLQHIRQDVNKLCEILQINKEQLYNILCGIIDNIQRAESGTFSTKLLKTEAGLQQFEQNFIQCIPLNIIEFNLMLQKLKEEEIQESSNILQKYLDEVDTNNVKDIIHTQTKNMLRKKHQASFSSFQQYIEQDKSVQADFLRLIISSCTHFHKQKHIFSFSQWSSFIISQKNQKLKQQVTLQPLLEVMQDDNLLKDKFAIVEQFLNSWNEFVGVHLQHECDTVDIKPLTLQSPLIQFTIQKDKKDNMYFFLLLSQMIQHQNDFLLKCHKLIDKMKDQHILKQDVDFLYLSKDQIIDFAQQDVLQIIQNNQFTSPYYGKGHEIHYDVSEICNVFISSFIKSKANIVLSNNAFFRAKDDITQREQLEQYEQITKKVPQQCFNSMSRFIDPLSTKDCSLLYDEVIIALNFLAQTGGDPQRSLIEYMGVFKKSQIQSLITNEFKLRHIIHLFEALESKLESSLVEGTYCSYRTELGDLERKLIYDLLQREKDIPVEEIMSALGKLCIRQLRFTQNQGPEAELFPYLFDEINAYLFRHEANVKRQEVMKMFQKIKIRIKHTYSLYKYMNEIQEENRNKEFKNLEESKKHQIINKKKQEKEINDQQIEEGNNSSKPQQNKK